MRWSACHALGKLGPVADAHVPALKQLLASDEASLRREAVQSLTTTRGAKAPHWQRFGRLGQAVDVEELLPLLSDPDGETRERACLALAASSEAAAPLAAKLLDPEPFVRRAAVDALAALGASLARRGGAKAVV